MQERPACPKCLRDRGLCRDCAQFDRSILPQIAQNRGWLKLIAGAAQLTPTSEIHVPDPDGERIRVRKQRKAVRRLALALQGKFTRSTRSRSAA